MTVIPVMTISSEGVGGGAQMDVGVERLHLLLEPQQRVVTGRRLRQDSSLDLEVFGEHPHRLLGPLSDQP
ncbi:hypothetical protein ACFO9E_19595 [Streptomyces maoxianensis]|uniref:Uncharacterized protein n=1 Tax=Streptomyces maoxianensis TaxID=1459942 RepID=A0ABV9GA61_9ACTN